MNEGKPTVVVSMKSPGIAILLTLLFGPLGMFYSTVTGAIFMLVAVPVIWVILFLASVSAGSGSLVLLTLGLGLATWPISIIWGAVAASSYNKRILAATTDPSPLSPDPAPARENPREKQCPFCGETILGVAIRCRYCHSDLPADRYRRAAVTDGEPVVPLPQPVRNPFLSKPGAALPDAPDFLPPSTTPHAGLVRLAVGVFAVVALASAYYLLRPGGKLRQSPQPTPTALRDLHSSEGQPPKQAAQIDARPLLTYFVEDGAYWDWMLFEPVAGRNARFLRLPGKPEDVTWSRDLHAVLFTVGPTLYRSAWPDSSGPEKIANLPKQYPGADWKKVWQDEVGGYRAFAMAERRPNSKGPEYMVRAWALDVKTGTWSTLTEKGSDNLKYGTGDWPALIDDLVHPTDGPTLAELLGKTTVESHISRAGKTLAETDEGHTLTIDVLGHPSRHLKFTVSAGDEWHAMAPLIISRLDKGDEISVYEEKENLTEQISFATAGNWLVVGYEYSLERPKLLRLEDGGTAFSFPPKSERAIWAPTNVASPAAKAVPPRPTRPAADIKAPEALGSQAARDLLAAKMNEEYRGNVAFSLSHTLLRADGTVLNFQSDFVRVGLPTQVSRLPNLRETLLPLGFTKVLFVAPINERYTETYTCELKLAQGELGCIEAGRPVNMGLLDLALEIQARGGLDPPREFYQNQGAPQ